MKWPSLLQSLSPALGGQVSLGRSLCVPLWEGPQSVHTVFIYNNCLKNDLILFCYTLLSETCSLELLEDDVTQESFSHFTDSPCLSV